MSIQDAPATFVMPHWAKHPELSKRYLNRTLATIFNQTDKNWQIVLIDDGSPTHENRLYLTQLQRNHPGKIHVIFKETNDGPGVCRNLGIQWAYKHNSPFVLFNDADDLSHPSRLELVRKAFVENPTASVIYTTFNVVDENDRVIPLEELTPSVVEVIEAHRQNPPQGSNAWIRIGTETGFINLTSATAVKTELAYRFPFPPERVSEDAHTWFRYSAGGGIFVYIDACLSSYRAPRYTAGSSSRSREGGKRGFYATKARVDAEGFREALKLALANNRISLDQQKELLIRFYLRLGQTLAREGEDELASAQIQAATAVSLGLTKQLITENGFEGQVWAQVKD